MSLIPEELSYTASHEWLRAEGNGSYLVGITDHAQEALGDVVFLELPKENRHVSAGEKIAVVESVKAASEIYAPIDGEIVAINNAAEDAPETLNSDPYGTWLIKLQADQAEPTGALLDAAAYRQAADD